MDDKERMLSAKEVGQMLSIAERTILAMAARGELDGVQVTGKRIWRFRREDIDEYLRRQREQRDRSSSA